MNRFVRDTKYGRKAKEEILAEVQRVRGRLTPGQVYITSEPEYYGKLEVDPMFVTGGEGGSMITVKKAELIEALEKNMKGHRAIFEEAQKGYRELVIEELDKRLQNARSGKEIDAFLSMEAPQDHTLDYQRIIAMLAMCTKDEVFISEKEFAHYVMDDWAWMHQFKMSNATYLTKARSTK